MCGLQSFGQTRTYSELGQQTHGFSRAFIAYKLVGMHLDPKPNLYVYTLPFCVIKVGTIFYEKNLFYTQKMNMGRIISNSFHQNWFWRVISQNQFPKYEQFYCLLQQLLILLVKCKNLKIWNFFDRFSQWNRLFWAKKILRFKM